PLQHRNPFDIRTTRRAASPSIRGLPCRPAQENLLLRLPALSPVRVSAEFIAAHRTAVLPLHAGGRLLPIGNPRGLIVQWTFLTAQRFLRTAPVFLFLALRMSFLFPEAVGEGPDA